MGPNRNKMQHAAGRTSAKGASLLIDLVSSLELPLSHPDVHVLRLGAGTGSLTHLLSSRFPILPILATDISPGMLDQLAHNTPPSPKSNISTKIADMNNPFASLGVEAEGGFSHVFVPWLCISSRIQLEIRYCGSGPASSGPPASSASQYGILRMVKVLKIWVEAATAVDPSYVPPSYPDPASTRWTSTKKVEGGMKEVGYKEIRGEREDIGFNVGTEVFMGFFWESGNPMTIHRRVTWPDQSTLGR